MAPAPDERDRIKAAIDRILAGTAQRSNGALTIVALAIEAEVPRNALTQRHTDLKNEFYARAKAATGTSEAEQRLRAQVAKLQAQHTQARAELAQYKTDVTDLVRAVNQLTLENRQLRRQLTEPDPVVRFLFTQPRPAG
jgi:chromosome segregation ATPase